MMLPAHRFGVGDTVRMSRMDRFSVGRKVVAEDADQGFVDGVVSRVRRDTLTLALSKGESGVAPVLQQLDLIADETTFKRMSKALEELASVGGHPVRQVLFGERKPRVISSSPAWSPFDGTLNRSQNEAIAFCLQSQDIAVIHGPPGTGKTTTVAELIKQFLAAGLRVLACAPSNIAVDNLLEKLAGVQPERYKPVRLGHIARLLPSVLDFSMENVLQRTDNALLCRDISQVRGTSVNGKARLPPLCSRTLARR